MTDLTPQERWGSPHDWEPRSAERQAAKLTQARGWWKLWEDDDARIKVLSEGDSILPRGKWLTVVPKSRAEAAEARVAELEILDPGLLDEIEALKARLQQATEALREALPALEALADAPVAKWSVVWIGEAQRVLPKVRSALATLAGEDDG